MRIDPSVGTIESGTAIGFNIFMTPLPPKSAPLIDYPESDGQPIADNTLQYDWIGTIHRGLTGVFKHDSNVFVAADLLWYPVEGDNKISAAPDALVALGRPQGYRGCYKQWEESGIAPQVVFEVLSPSNWPADIQRKFLFYQRYGVEEYYFFDPYDVQLLGYRREGDKLVEIPQMDGWVSPRLGIRFDLSGEDLAIFAPDGEPFLNTIEVLEEQEANRRIIQEKTRLAEEEKQARLQAQRRADRAQSKLDQEKKNVQAERMRSQAAEEKAGRLAEQLRQLGITPSE